MVVPTLWPELTVFAHLTTLVHPFDPRNKGLFRGEEAFDPTITGWQRWAKPSPEPEVDEKFRALVLHAIDQNAPQLKVLVDTLVTSMMARLTQPPLLIAILRAGVPLAALLAHGLSRQLHAAVPMVALSLFDGIGWDEQALHQALRTYPNRSVWFVDGWTSQGGVVRQLVASYEQWRAQGYDDFTEGWGPRLAVLCDPKGLASLSATQLDYFVPSACFTAPETLGFSRGFVVPEGGLFHVYAYPTDLAQFSLIQAWMAIAEAPASPLAFAEPTGLSLPPPSGWRIHVNEVARALINRNPYEVLFQADELSVGTTLAPLVYLCKRRNIPMRYNQSLLTQWQTQAAARLTGGPL